MTVVALVLGAAILLTLMLVQSYSGEEVPRTRGRRARRGSDGGDGAWMFGGGDSGGGDCSGADAGGGCDGGGGD